MDLTPLEPWVRRKIGIGDASGLHPALDAYQIEKLNETLCLAREHSSFYAQALRGCPLEVDSMNDLALFPFTYPGDLRKEGLRFLCVSQSHIHRIVTLDTSGTTGSPKRICFTAEDQELTVDFFRCGMSTFTNPGDRVLILLPAVRPGSVGDLLATGLERLKAIPVRYGPITDPEQALTFIRTEQVNVIVGAPINVLTLARHWQTSPNIPQSHIDAVLLSTDYVPDSLKTALETIWGCRVYNHYGMTEMGLGGGVECQARSGYHLREADLLFEIIHPITGQSVCDGEEGEVVFTTLTRRGMPLIRYRTGDLSRFRLEKCPCGTGLRTMDRIHRRSGHEIFFGSGRLESHPNPSKIIISMPDLDEALFPVPALIDFQAFAENLDGKDFLVVKAVVLPGHQPAISKEIVQRLEGVAAIRLALEMGILDLKVEIQVSNGTHAISLAKRTIKDRRGEQNA